VEQTNNNSPNNDTDTQSNPTNISKKGILFDTLRLLLGSGSIIALDQWTKSLVIKNIPFLETWLPENLEPLAPYARIVHWRNSGAAFGMFQNGNLVIMILAIVASIFIIYYFPQIEKKEWPIRLAMVFQLAGAVGNLIDRIRFSYVIDFISVGDFPVFNIADSSITIGVTILIIGMIYQEHKERKLIPSQTQNEVSTDLEESQL
jgi:signal peptidase II